MVGILVHGNNHFVLSGPLPDEATAMALVRYWSIIQIGEAKSSSFGQWEIRSKEFRENLVFRRQSSQICWRARRCEPSSVPTFMKVV